MCAGCLLSIHKSQAVRCLDQNHSRSCFVFACLILPRSNSVDARCRYTPSERAHLLQSHGTAFSERMLMERPLARSTTTVTLVILTGLIFFGDLQFKFGFATWLPYFLLAIPVSSLYSRGVFLCLSGGGPS